MRECAIYLCTRRARVTALTWI